MNEINKESPNLISENQQWLKEKFPSCFVEGKLDFDRLKELVSGITDERDEKYSFSWAGRSNSIKNIQVSSIGALIPDKKESVNFDDTENIFIEGENLEVLKLLQKTYSEKIKMIYIDPPYNTGHDFLYDDNFTSRVPSYLEQSGQSKDGVKLVSNLETSGRFHSDWLSFMYPRLWLAHSLLTDDGVLFVSIGDEEVHNLRNILNEIFGEENFQGHVHWRRRHNQPNDPTKMIAKVGEHILVFAKNNSYLKQVGVGKIGLSGDFSNPDDDSRGDWSSKPWKVGTGQTGTRYLIKTPTGKIYDEEWMGDQKTFEKLLNDKRIIFTKNGDGLPRKKYFKSEREKEGQVATNWWKHQDFGSNQDGTAELATIFGEKNVFENPKPTKLLKNILDIANCHDGDIVLDFFAGSCTLADAVLQKNCESSTNIQFLTVQIPEILNENSDSYKISYDFLKKLKKPLLISEIGKERIRRVLTNIQNSEQKKSIDISKQDLGFKVFKLAKSNYKIWEDVQDETKLKEQLKLFEDPLIENYKDIDVIYEIILKEGYSLNSKIEEFQKKPNKIYKVSDTEFFFYVTLDKKLDEGSTQNLELSENTMFVCLDSAIDDSQKTNLDKLCKLRTI